MRQRFLAFCATLLCLASAEGAGSKEEARFERAAKVLARMTEVWDANPILSAGEKWRPVTSIRRLETPEVQLSIYLGRGLIVISNGFLDEIQKIGPDWEHALAATLGHELAHRVFTNENWCEQVGLRNMHHRLRCLARSRDEERRADILGARLACQAGANLNRVVVFWTHMERQRRWEASWFRHHPPARERAAFLEREFAECAARQASGRHREPLTSLDVMNVRW